MVILGRPAFVSLRRIPASPPFLTGFAKTVAIILANYMPKGRKSESNIEQMTRAYNSRSRNAPLALVP